ncbi:MAG: sulfotransferase [Myxococcota bacterium]
MNVGSLAPEVRAEDPAPSVPRGLRRARAVLVQHVLAVLIAPVGLALWPLYLLARLFLPRPPHLPPPARFRHVAGLVLTADASPPGIDALDRWRLLLHLAQTFLLAPVPGLAWMLDEVLYGRALARNPVTAPLFEVSAWRSGSTRLAQLLHDDPHLAAPASFQMFVPYLWVWRLARFLLAGRVDPEAITRRIRASLPPEFVARHEVDPFRTDTYDVIFYRHQLVPYAMMLGPAATLGEFSHRGVTPTTRRMWEDDFVRMVDGLGRRTLAFAGPAPDGRPRRFFLKGHFLAAAPALAARWPDARFLTVVRDPAPRIRSTLNYLRLTPDFFGLGPIPWSVVAAVAPAEAEYSRAEMAWFTRDDGVRRCVLRFDTFVRDLPRALRHVYRTCLDADGPPPEVRLDHTRHRAAYTLDHPLEALGVDVAALEAELADYRAWCRGEA